MQVCNVKLYGFTHYQGPQRGRGIEKQKQPQGVHPIGEQHAALDFPKPAQAT